MPNLDFFGLQSSGDLYKIALDTYADYARNPTEKDFLFLVFSFTHLREWIAGGGQESILKRKRSGAPLSPGEIFFLDIYEMPEFRIVQELCNRGKHYKTGNENNQTSQAEGFLVGLSRMGDTLGQTHFLIDGNDSRDLFVALIQKYNSWFSENPPNRLLQVTCEDAPA